MDRSDAPQVLRDFLVYHETIRGHSKNTVDEYYLDLRTFFRYLKLSRPSSNAPSPVESREAPPNSSFPGFSEPP